ncbi:ABC transporter permease [Paenibacillus sp.]|uniref:ABC transporter permease n=1 Tax=Paenibacillus sp. TaxID=58172 RepID=UPI002D760114|nr:ABC transporter permease [Paenibacillus sp.]HZG56611.1 ABC transporter permease [Paenibacillus sp.]
MNGANDRKLDAFLLPLLAILIGLTLGAVVMLLGGYDPIAAYQALLNKAFGSMYNFGETIRQITPLILTGLAVAFAFRTGLFNIGAEGQFLVGSLASLYVGIEWTFLPPVAHAAAAVAAGALAGAFWGALVGYAKAKRGVHEVITSIMLNWIALFFVNYMVRTFFLPSGQQRSVPVAESAFLNIPFVTELFNNARLNFGFVIALVAAVFFHYYLFRTKGGFELRAVGFNRHAAQYAGMNVNGGIVRAMAISGAFAGIAGATEVLGVFHYQSVLTVSPGYGFQGIAVAMIGGAAAFGTVLGAVLMGILTFGAAGMQFGAKVPPELVSIIIALIIFFLAASGIIKPLTRWTHTRKARKEAEKA